MCFKTTTRTCGHTNARPRPLCPSSTQGTSTTDCDSRAKQLVLLDTRAAPIFELDRPGRRHQNRSRFLDLPLDVLEQILMYLLITPAEIYLGIVTLEKHLPHHWHPAQSLRREEPRYNSYYEDGLGRAPVCRHKRAKAPYGLCSSLLSVNRQLHAVAARILYARNSFAIDLGVPTTQEAAWKYDVSKLRLEQVIPLNPTYHKLLRNVSFRHYNDLMRTYPVRFFHSAMASMLSDMPGVFTAFRRRYDINHGGFDFETFAGWSPAATPNWLSDASPTLSICEPLITTNASMFIDEVHWLMSTLWEVPLENHSRASTTHEKSTCLDVCVMSDPAVYAGPWHPDNSQSRQAARIFLVRPLNDKFEHPWQDDRPRKLYSHQWYSRLQTWIVGKSRGLQHAPTRKRQSHTEYVGSTFRYVWRDGPKGKKRRVFTAPMSLLVPPACRLLRDEQLKREDQRQSKEYANVLTLPVDGECTGRPFHERLPRWQWPNQYEYV